MQGKKREKQADALGWIWMSKIRDERREKKGRKERVSIEGRFCGIPFIYQPHLARSFFGFVYARIIIIIVVFAISWIYLFI